MTKNEKLSKSCFYSTIESFLVSKRLFKTSKSFTEVILLQNKYKRFNNFDDAVIPHLKAEGSSRHLRKDLA